MKTIGIASDNYKLDKFKQELTAKGFTNFTVSPFTDKSSIIQVKAADSDIITIQTICQKVQNCFNPRNN